MAKMNDTTNIRKVLWDIFFQKIEKKSTNKEGFPFTKIGYQFPLEEKKKTEKRIYRLRYKYTEPRRKLIRRFTLNGKFSNKYKHFKALKTKYNTYSQRKNFKRKRSNKSEKSNEFVSQEIKKRKVVTLKEFLGEQYFNKNKNSIFYSTDSNWVPPSEDTTVLILSTDDLCSDLL